MSFLRSTVLLTTIAVAAAVLFAQPSHETRAKEAALKKNLRILRQAIDEYTVDQHKGPQALQGLVINGYVGSIPVDPMTGKSTWCVMPDPGRIELGIRNVHSCSDGVSSDGTLYSGW